MEKNQEQLQKELQEKNNELAILQANVLSEAQKEEKKQLETDIKDIQRQLNEFKQVETEITVNTTKNTTEELKEYVRVEMYSTNEIIQDSTMYNKLLEIGKTPEEIEIFGNNIDATVKKYLDQELIGFSEEIRNNMSVGIQFAMMDVLMKDGSNGANFFESFSKTGTDSGKGVLVWFFGAFSKSDVFFQLANKVQNITQYLNINKNKIPQQAIIPELNNPYKFMKLLEHDRWKNMNDLYTLDISTVLTLDSSEWVCMSDEEKKLLWDISNNEKMNTVITAKSIAAIEKSLVTAQNVLDKRAGFKDTASSLFETIFSKFDFISSINIPFLWSLWALIGVDWPIQLFGKHINKLGKDGKKKKSILDFILTGLGFSGGLEWLHKSYVMEGLDPLMVDTNKSFISDVYTYYKQSADTNLSNTDSESTGQKLTSLLKETDPTKKQAIIDKLPADYMSIKKALVASLDDNMVLSKSIIQQFYTESNIYREDGSVDISLISDRDAFIEKYLQFILPKLANSGDTFIHTCPNVDTFLVTVAGFLVGGKYFQEAMNLWLISAAEYGESLEQQNPSLSEDSERIDYNGIHILSLSKTGLTHCKLSETEYPSFAKKVIQIAQRLWTNPEYIMKVIAFETGWTFDPAIKNAVGSGATGLIQFMPTTATSLWVTPYRLSQMTALQQLDYVERYFLPHKDTLKTLEDVYLAVFSPTLIGKPLDHVAYSKWSPAYEQNQWFDLNKDGKMTITEITQKIRESTDMYTFFDVPFRESSVERDDSAPQIFAKNFDELILIGDSHAGGIKTMSGLDPEKTNNFYYFNGNDTGQLLANVKKNKTQYIDSGIKSLLLVTWANDITKNSVGTMRANLEAIRDEIAPVQLVLTTLQYYSDKIMVPDSKVDGVNTIIRDFAQENWLPVIDINKNVILASSDYQSDKRHLTTSWYTKIVGEIESSLG